MFRWNAAAAGPGDWATHTVSMPALVIVHGKPKLRPVLEIDSSTPQSSHGFGGLSSPQTSHVMLCHVESYGALAFHGLHAAVQHVISKHTVGMYQRIPVPMA